jgi:hypothetical protein
MCAKDVRSIVSMNKIYYIFVISSFHFSSSIIWYIFYFLPTKKGPQMFDIANYYILNQFLFFFSIGLMIYRNEIRFFETMVFYKHRIKRDIDSSYYVQYLNALECEEWQGTIVKIRFSWWSFSNIKGKHSLYDHMDFGTTMINTLCCFMQVELF